MSTVRIAQAGLNEWGGTHGGEAGNQKRTPGKLDGELNVREWYNKPWKYCLRCKDITKARIIAQTAYACVANANIGYDQNERTTLYWELVKSGFIVENINPCECDCSELVAVCVNAAGIEVSPDMYTGNEKELLMLTGMFDCFEDIEHCQSTAGLKVGDILLKPNSHTVIVLDDYIPEEGFIDKYKVVNGDVNLRLGPSTQHDAITVIKNGEIVYVAKTEGNWAYLLYDIYTGWASLNYLEKQVEPDPKPPIDLITTGDVNLRVNAGVEYKELIVIPINTHLICDGTTKLSSDNVLWYKVSYMGYNGFISSKYAEEIRDKTQIKPLYSNGVNLGEFDHMKYNYVIYEPYKKPVIILSSNEIL